VNDDRRKRLLEAYRATVYEADVDGTTVGLRIGEPVPAWWQPNATWAFISGANPGSRRLSHEDNLSRHRALETELAGRGFEVFQGWGVPEADDWEPEISLLVTGIGREEAVAIGRDFGQVAIVYGEIGSVAQLVVIDGPDSRPG